MNGSETLLLSRSVAMVTLVAGSFLLVDGLFETAARSVRKSRDRIREMLLRRSLSSDKSTSGFCEIDMSKMD